MQTSKFSFAFPPNLREAIIVSSTFLAILLIGYGGMFVGHTFFTEGDAFTLFSYNMKNAQSNGWRPDLGLGETFFHGDPGAFHVWSLFRWWHHLFVDPIVAYNTSIILLFWISCIAHYFLLKRVIPTISRTMAICLASLIPFSSLQQEFFFQRHWILFPAGACFISIIIYDFIKRPALRHYFLYSLTLFICLNLASVAILLQLIMVSIPLYLILAFNLNPYNRTQNFWLNAKNFFLLNLASGLTVFLLSAWTFYSLLLEKFKIGYVRDPDYSAIGVQHNLTMIFGRIMEYLHAGLLSSWTTVLGISQKAPIGLGWNNVSPFFPIALILILFYKSTNAWERSIKYMVIGITLFHELTAWFPWIMNRIFLSILPFYPPEKFHPVLQTYEIVVIAILIHSLQSKEKIPLRAWSIARAIAAFLSLMYAALFIVSSTAVIAPNTLSSIGQSLLEAGKPWIHSQESFQLYQILIVENARLFHETMSYIDILFYSSTFVLMFFIARDYLPTFLKYRKGVAVAIFLLINNILLSWVAFPMNKNPSIWDQHKIDGVLLSESFKSTDRLSRLTLPRCNTDERYVKCIEQKFFSKEYGARRNTLGYELTPGLEFSGIKSYTQKDTAEFILKFLAMENFPTQGALRVIQSGLPITSSRIFDMGAVNYFFSEFPLPPSENLEKVYFAPQFFLYRNLNAWPYYYFAKRVEYIENYADLFDAEKGVAYLWANANSTQFEKEIITGQGNIELHKFKFGEIEFKTSSPQEEFLVITDAWHPNWRAQIDGNDTEILKTNGVFKGLLLSSGQHKVRLYFDNTPYLPGVWISILAWIVFLSGWIFTTRFLKNNNFQKASHLQ
ncbi:MAG: hypothetical protein COV66_05185 [Nitrospinae bacterium CG11_big_fil_rev_8_21_14_0_20_45_15]|nr:MAG: hypothetical protein COV66_05185 [Nitrospinae bacterium CG11_big_fil_rev_8_21_14_0_20_45_15]